MDQLLTWLNINQLEKYQQIQAEIREDNVVCLDTKFNQEVISNNLLLTKELCKENELPKWIK